ncbi:hypothetical protein DYU11_11125 [Fibrisoma montanum]|uniref:Uncharacterized protein n=1 Tax=Fibrisoma montanum TaxID=2305895 RepID=A0A418MAZ9_9BACT|nr:hypothetical protein [Fibrisoma montanum]RIV23534.1 hypothetical protein DYU11_11125 [Fibrisoma montanum]
MKKVLLLALIGSGCWLAARPTDVLTQTGVTLEAIRQHAVTNLTEDHSFSFTSTVTMRKLARRLPKGSQATVVRSLGRVVRSYVEAETFENEYVTWLRTKYPLDETYSDEQIARLEAHVSQLATQAGQQQSAEQRKLAELDAATLLKTVRGQLQQQEQDLAKLTASDRARKTMEIGKIKRMLVATEGRPDEFKKQYVAFQTQLSRQQIARTLADEQQLLADAKEHNRVYRTQKEAFTARENHQVLLKKRLREFIALCDDVTFDARVSARGRTQEFVEDRYRRKSPDWKFLYRLGREPVQEARAFAQEWLADLQKVSA